MIVVHHLEHSRSQRILWLLEELGQPYEVVRYRREADLTAPPDLKAAQPLGKAPFIEDGGLVLAESGAIAEYLVERYGPNGLAPPPGAAERPAYLFFMHFAEGTLGVLNGARLWLRRVGPPAQPAVDKVELQIGAALDLVDATLRERQFLAGGFSAADTMMSFPLQAARVRGLLRPEHDAIRAYLERIERRPAFLRAVERGGPFAVPA